MLCTFYFPIQYSNNAAQGQNGGWRPALTFWRELAGQGIGFYVLGRMVRNRQVKVRKEQGPNETVGGLGIWQIEDMTGSCDQSTLARDVWHPPTNASTPLKQV